jgi:hypothetical protein
MERLSMSRLFGSNLRGREKSEEMPIILIELIDDKFIVARQAEEKWKCVFTQQQRLN